MPLLLTSDIIPIVGQSKLFVYMFNTRWTVQLSNNMTLVKIVLPNLSYNK